jgi:GR25 family glycosyltransferase involved in LPS biosynthesis
VAVVGAAAEPEAVEEVVAAAAARNLASKQGEMVDPSRRGKTRKLPKGGAPLSQLDIFHTPVYVINMKERPDRWKLFLEQGPAPKALQIHRAQAFNGKALNYLKDPRISTATRLNIMRNDRRTHPEVATLGAVGCSISHAMIWKTIVAKNLPYAVVLEDDARFTLEDLQRVNELAKTIPDKAAMWVLGLYKPNRVHEPYPNSDWSRIYTFTASHAYVITRAAAKKFLEQVFPIEMHIDHYMSSMSTLYDMPIVQHKDVFFTFGGILKKGSKTTVAESNTSQHQKDGCSACHVPDHLSRFYKRVGPKTRAGRIVHGLLRNKVSKKVLTYKTVRKSVKDAK